MKLTVLICMTGSLWAQSVDLTGDWKLSPTDDPAWARVAVDDTQWPVIRLPRTERLARGDYWLRRQIAAFDVSQFKSPALALGIVAECYEVYLNGVFAGNNGCVPGEPVAFYRPRVFGLPKTLLPAEGPLVIALRVHASNTDQRWAAARGLRDEGPYLFSETVHAANEVRLALQRHQLAMVPAIVMGCCQILMSLVLLALWFYFRQARELLWLGLFLLVIPFNTGAASAMVYLGGAYPAWAQTASPVGFALLTGCTYLILRGREIPWWPLLGVTVLALAMRFYFAPQYYWLVSFAWPIWLCAGTLLKPGGREKGFATATLLYALAVLTPLATEVLRVPLVPLYTYAGGFLFWHTQLFLTATNIVMLLNVMRGVGADRQEKSRLAAEVDAARQIQQLLLSSAGSSAEYAIDAVYLPASEVGGDFYQVLDRADGSRLVLVGDVSGKGLKAAMLVSVAVGVLRNEKSSSPAAVLSSLNEALLGQGGFVTCCVIRYRPGGKLTIASAGHPAPYGEGRELDVAPGLPLGVVAEAEWQDTTLKLRPGSQVTLVSDGVVEAENSRRELFGFDRTREISGRSAADIAAAAKAWGQNDDITVVTVRRCA